MSENVTVLLKIARESHATSPEPDHYLVIFEEVDEGKRFVKVVDVGQTFVPENPGKLKGIFARKTHYVGYAVNPAPAEIEFSSRYAYDHCRFFTLNFTLRLTITAPRIVVERLKNDPIKRVQEEVKRRMGQAVRECAWSDVKDDFDRVAQIIADDGHPAIGKIRDRAEDYGIAIEELLVSCRLDEKETVVERGILAEESKRALMTLAKETEHHELQLEVGLEASRLNLETAKAHTRAKVSVQQTILQAFETSVKNLASNIKSPHEFQTASKAFIELMQESLPQLTMDTSSEEAAQSATDSAYLTQLLPKLQLPLEELPEDVLSGEEGFVQGYQRALTLLETLTCDETQKQRIKAAVLHVVAEQALGSVRDEACYAHYVQQLKAEVAKLSPPSVEYEEFVNQLLNKTVLSDHKESALESADH